VLRVVVAEGRAVGVEVERAGRRGIVAAAREVVVCGGAIGSPQMLMLSGIGPAEHLRADGIEVHADLPVGRDLRDHPVTPVLARTDRPVSLKAADSPANLARWVVAPRGMLASPVAQAGAFLRTRPGLAAPDLELLFAPVLFVDEGRTAPPEHGFTIGPVVLKPRSRGTVTLRSADPLAAPAIAPGYLSEPEDVATMVARIGLARELLGSRALAPWMDGELAPRPGRSRGVGAGLADGAVPPGRHVRDRRSRRPRAAGARGRRPARRRRLGAPGHRPGAHERHHAGGRRVRRRGDPRRRSRRLARVGRFVAPDVLVLAGGGVVGEAWMTGVLAGIEDASGADLRRVEALVGTSAGAIVSARLAAGKPLRRPAHADGAAVSATGDTGDGDGLVRTAARWGWAMTAPLAPVATALATPGGALLRSALLSRAPGGGETLDRLHGEVERAGVRFDGRLRICCVDKRSGRRVVFGAPGAPQPSVADAVTASCAIPWVFAPVRIDGREYVDGGVWSVTNLDAAPARRDTEVLCLDPTAALRSPVRQAFRVAIAVELQILRARGARVRHVGPDEDAAGAMGEDFMARAAAEPALTEGYRQGRALAG
jgi:NTE family protein